MATSDPPKGPGEPSTEPSAELPIEDTDTSATPPERDATAAPAPVEAEAPAAAKPPLDDVVAALIDEKPTRPRLVVVPSAPEHEAEAAPATKKRARDEDPLAVVLDGAGREGRGDAEAEGAEDEPETLEDAWTKAKAEVAKIDLGKILDLGGLTTGLRQLAGWVEKQIPALNAAVSKFLNTVETALATPPPGAGGTTSGTPGAGEEASAASKPTIKLVPDDGAEAKLGKEADDMQPNPPSKDTPSMLAAAPSIDPGIAPETDPDPAPMKDPEPGPDPAPVHDPDPMPDPNPGTDPLPMGDPLPKPNPSPGEAPVHDPVQPYDPNPGGDPLPMGDPIPMNDPNPGRDPLPMGDPVVMPTMGSSSSDVGDVIGTASDGDDDPDPTPHATD